jgi:hypothetical protein
MVGGLTMAPFKMGLPEGMLDTLSATPWWKELLAYRYNGQHLFIAVRKNYLSAYLLGRAVFKKISRDNKGKIVARFDRRYLFGPNAAPGDLTFDGEAITGKDGTTVEHEDAPPNFERWVRRVKSYGLVNLDDDELSDQEPDLSEKACLAPRALAPSVINLEMALPGYINPTTGKVTAARIDMAHLAGEQGGAKLVFTEVKLFDNKALRAETDKDPNVLTEQIFPYRDYLAQRTVEITEAYRSACSLLVIIRRQQIGDVHPLIVAVSEGAPLTVSTVSRLLIFRTRRDAKMRYDAWLPHRQKIERAGIEIEEADCSVP